MAARPNSVSRRENAMKPVQSIIGESPCPAEAMTTDRKPLRRKGFNVR